MLKWTLLLGMLLIQDPHEGQPESCNNYHNTKTADRCKCYRAMKCSREREGLGEDPKCQTYCRKENCKCLDPCTS